VAARKSHVPRRWMVPLSSGWHFASPCSWLLGILGLMMIIHFPGDCTHSLLDFFFVLESVGIVTWGSESCRQNSTWRKG
jgi:hypothetical protein